MRSIIGIRKAVTILIATVFDQILVVFQISRLKCLLQSFCSFRITTGLLENTLRWFCLVSLRLVIGSSHRDRDESWFRELAFIYIFNSGLIRDILFWSSFTLPVLALLMGQVPVVFDQVLCYLFLIFYNVIKTVPSINLVHRLDLCKSVIF